MGEGVPPVSGEAPQADALLELLTASSDQGATCALLTPAVKARMREMATGQVLEIVIDDPTAGEDLASWCRLSGHELIGEVAGTEPLLRFFVRKTHA
jgi:TusA-related sulfurtransferase